MLIEARVQERTLTLAVLEMEARNIFHGTFEFVDKFIFFRSVSVKFEGRDDDVRFDSANWAGSLNLLGHLFDVCRSPIPNAFEAVGMASLFQEPK